FEVLATGGDTALGGDDFDQVLAQWIAEQAGVSLQGDHHLNRQLLNVATETKVALSDAETVTIQLANWQGEIRREQFETLIENYVKRTLMACRRALKDAGV
ncbi:Hsp70 family protein, partial [Escherichia coli]|nr:Hsp70 family protein [Escherichia coli]